MWPKEVTYWPNFVMRREKEEIHQT